MRGKSEHWLPLFKNVNAMKDQTIDCTGLKETKFKDMEAT